MELIKTLKVNNELGLHARAAFKIVALANQHKSRLFLSKDNSLFSVFSQEKNLIKEELGLLEVDYKL